LAKKSKEDDKEYNKKDNDNKDQPHESSKEVRARAEAADRNKKFQQPSRPMQRWRLQLTLTMSSATFP